MKKSILFIFVFIVSFNLINGDGSNYTGIHMNPTAIKPMAAPTPAPAPIVSKPIVASTPTISATATDRSKNPCSKGTISITCTSDSNCCPTQSCQKGMFGGWCQ